MGTDEMRNAVLIIRAHPCHPWFKFIGFSLGKPGSRTVEVAGIGGTNGAAMMSWVFSTRTIT
jgi:hypothetical protein